MAEPNNTEISQFKTKSYSQRRRRNSTHINTALRAANLPATGKKQQNNKRKDPVTSLIGIMTVAVMACMVLLAFALSGSSVISRATQSVREVLQSDMPLDEALGKLKFVSENISSVFGITRSAFIIPVEGATLAAPYDESIGVIELLSVSGKDVVTSASGTVKAITPDTGGQTIEIDHGGGAVMIYKRLTNLCVEEGQPLRQGDAIGRVGSAGGIDVMLLQDGTPRDISALLGLSVD